jgi:hypothetical protein
MNKDQYVTRNSRSEEPLQQSSGLFLANATNADRPVLGVKLKANSLCFERPPYGLQVICDWLTLAIFEVFQGTYPNMGLAG